MRMVHVISAALLLALSYGCSRAQPRHPTAHGGGPPASATPMQPPAPASPQTQLPSPYANAPELLP